MVVLTWNLPLICFQSSANTMAVDIFSSVQDKCGGYCSVKLGGDQRQPVLGKRSRF